VPVITTKIHLASKYCHNLIGEIAISGKINFLVTGNKKHFPKKFCKGIKILSPSEFLRELAV